jgi:Flp pilus assembly protein TadD
MIPCEVEHELAVEGSSKGAAEGVKMLRADQYAEALSSFKSALAENPEDHQAAFGAGVASEVLGQPEQALDYYRKAFAMQNEPTYGKAKDRLNQDSKHIRKGK